MYDKRRTLSVDRAHLWHPYTAMRDYKYRDPVVMVKGKGVKLYDADGCMYYDTVASWWCNVHGHGHPSIRRGIAKQLKQLEHVHFAGVTHPWAAELTDRLREFLDPRLSRFFFSDNGSTSVEIALKMAFQYWQNRGVESRTRFVFLENSYHGDTVGAMSVGGIDLYHRLYAPLRFKSFQAASPNCSACPDRESGRTYDARSTGCSLQCFQSMEALLRREGSSIAAVIVEPLMQGAAGMLLYPPSYLRKLRELTDELDILLIFDEVATGFGRTGTFFAYEQAGVIPDILCLAKGLTAGYLPMGLTITRESIYQAFYADPLADRTFLHGHTYTANPLACAAGIESLKLFGRLRLPASRADLVHWFHHQLRAFEGWECVADIRYLGFVGAIDIVQSREPIRPSAPEDRVGWRIYLEGLKQGLLLRPLGDTVYWMLPLSVKRSEVTDIMQRSHLAIGTATASVAGRR
jgi:adenosylmethionine-8-amino-7-oxononanoate aminotransferase